MAEWGVLDRSDLRKFDGEQQELILSAVTRGAVGRVTGSGHVMLRGPNGRTTTIASSSNRRRLANYSAAVRRLFSEEGDMTEEQEQPEQEPKFDCPVTRCDRWFVDEVGLNQHIDEAHIRCKDCGHPAGDLRGLTAHRRIKHEGWKPALGKGKRKRKGEAKIPEQREAVELEVVQPAVEEVEAPEQQYTHVPEQFSEYMRALHVRLNGAVDRIFAAPQLEALATLASWHNTDRQKLEAELEARDKTIATLEQQLGDLHSKIQLLKEALEA